MEFFTAMSRAWTMAVVRRRARPFPTLQPGDESLDRDRRVKLRATFMTAGAAAPTRARAVREDPEAAPASAPASKDGAPSAASPRRTPPATRGPGRPAAATYEVFGGRYTLSQISRMSECAVTYTTLRNRLTAPDNPDRQGTPQEVEAAATLPPARGRRRTTERGQ
ncbi:hypothetical protein [Streptomyces pratensis]|uniref:hypothetical protein n=1 Tax=Streptomyces pratensis TaxID=1169025 RepID=UPI00301AE894